MKTVLSLIATLALLCTGCKMFGSNPSAPTAMESKFFDVTTNFVPRYVTNQVLVPVFMTNVVTQTITVTNTTGLVIPQINTTYEYKTVNQTNTIVATNWVEAYDYKPNKTTGTVATISGTLSNLGIPGIGGLVTAVLLGAAGAYGKMRSTLKTSDKINGVLTQGIETAREVISNTPQGQELDAKFKQYLKDHQEAAGVLKQVSNLVADNVNNSAAQGAAAMIKAELPVITEITVAATPVSTTVPPVVTVEKG